MSILWIGLIGFIAGLIARVVAPGANSPTGFLLTTVLGIAGAFAATFIGQSIGCQRSAESPQFGACNFPHFGGVGDQPFE